MKRSKLFVLFTTALFLSVFALLSEANSAQAKKNNITYTVKKGTLTVKGKGEISRPINVKNKKKVKKIVIKNGITSIPLYCFDDYKNLREVTIAKSVKTIGQSSFYTGKQLKKVTLPGKFRMILAEGDDASNSIFSFHGVDTVVFNTKLDLSVLTSILCENFKVKASDPNYKSIDGVIYSKDGTDIVRVPFQKEILEIAEGTENFCLYSILYSTEDWEGDPLYTCKLKEITLPSSLKKVEKESYKPASYSNEFGEITFNIHTKQLDGRSLALLYSEVGCYDESRGIIKSIAGQLPEQISLVNDMYITSDGMLLTYTGKEVTAIGARAFSYQTAITKVQLPEGLTEIGDYAFDCCMDWLDDSKTIEINIPSTVTTIGEHAFNFAAVKELTLPENLKVVGAYAFSNTKLENLIIPNTITNIPEGLCYGCSSLTSVTFSKDVKSIGNQAFQGCPLVAFDLSAFSSLTKVGYFALDEVEWSILSLPSSLKKAKAYAFAKAKKIVVPKDCVTIDALCGTCPDTVFQFEGSPKYWNTSFYFESSNLRKGKVTAKLEWNKIAKTDTYKKIGYQIVLSKKPNCKKVLKKITITKNVNTLVTSFKSKDIEVYGKIRPFVIKNGKKIYGKWSKVETNI